MFASLDFSLSGLKDSKVDPRPTDISDVDIGVHAPERTETMSSTNPFPCLMICVVSGLGILQDFIPQSSAYFS